MTNYKFQPWVILICFLILLMGLYMISSCYFKCGSARDHYLNFGGPAYTSSCEFQPACLWDTARWVQLSNGMEGVCNLHGIACPAFSKDHDRSRNMGLSPTMVSDRYMQKLADARKINGKEKYGGGGGDYIEDGGGDYDTEGYFDEDGSTALSLGTYPTSLG